MCVCVLYSLVTCVFVLFCLYCSSYSQLTVMLLEVFCHLLLSHGWRLKYFDNCLPGEGWRLCLLPRIKGTHEALDGVIWILRFDFSYSIVPDVEVVGKQLPLGRDLGSHLVEEDSSGGGRAERRGTLLLSSCAAGDGRSGSFLFSQWSTWCACWPRS